MRFFRIASMGAVLGAATIAGLTQPQDSTPVKAERVSDDRFVTIQNRDETMTLQVPAAWRDVSQGPWLYHGVEVGYFLTASTNLADFQGGRPAPGVFMGVFADPANSSMSRLLDTEKLDVEKRCRSVGRSAYKDNFYIGNIDDYEQCGGGKQRSLVSVVRSGDGSTVLLRVSIASGADLATVNRVFESFQVLGDVNEGDHGHAD